MGCLVDLVVVGRKIVVSDSAMMGIWYRLATKNNHPRILQLAHLTYTGYSLAAHLNCSSDPSSQSFFECDLSSCSADHPLESRKPASNPPTPIFHLAYPLQRILPRIPPQLLQQPLFPFPSRLRDAQKWPLVSLAYCTFGW